MENFDPLTTFNDEVSKRYDEELRGDEAETVAFLADLAGDGTALEFAVGTGRIAVPLARAGVQVDGIESSRAMINRLREKGGERIQVAIGDMARIVTGATYRLVYLVYNTIGNLLTQEDQVCCFENAARHLDVDGVFVLECRVPTAPCRGRQFIDAERVEVDHVVLGVCQYDPVSQVLDETHVRIGADEVVLSPIRLRLAGPAEFDLMARVAGLKLRARWGGWNAEPFDATSWRHVSVYEPAR